MNDEHKNFVGEVALKALIEKEGKVLISKDNTSDKWDLPGGRMQEGESPQEGLAREVLEEIGVYVEIGRPFYTEVGVPTRPGGHQRFFIVYMATLRDAEQPFSLAPNEIEEVRWVSKEELVSIPLYGEYRRALDVFFQIMEK